MHKSIELNYFEHINILESCNQPGIDNNVGYHADTPITIKAEPSIWPTAAFINIHEHPI